MKKILFTLMFLCSLQASAHCPIDFSAFNLCGDIEWTNGPVVNQTSAFRLTFWEKGDHNHTPVTPAQDVHIYSWMVMDNGMNHGGPALTYTEVETGIYEVLDARFFMHGMNGYWEIRIDLTDSSRNILTGSHRVNLGDTDGNGSGHDHGHNH